MTGWACVSILMAGRGRCAFNQSKLFARWHGILYSTILYCSRKKDLSYFSKSVFGTLDNDTTLPICIPKEEVIAWLIVHFLQNALLSTIGTVILDSDKATTPGLFF